MVLPVDTESYNYRFYSNLNNDVKLKSNEYGEWDIVFDNDLNDWVNIDGFDSLANACIIAIMTRFNELKIETYEDFGCRVHELIKTNKSRNIIYRIELFITDTLESIRRVRKVNWVIVEDNPNHNKYNYLCKFCVSCTSDEDLEDVNSDLLIVEEKFYI